MIKPDNYIPLLMPFFHIVVGFSDNPGTMLSTKLPLTYIKCSKPDGSEARFVSGNVYIPIEDTIIVKQQTGT